MTLDAFRQLCADYGETDPALQNGHLRRLHHLGILFYFGLLENEQELNTQGNVGSFDRDTRHIENNSVDLPAVFSNLPPGQKRLLEYERHDELTHWIIDPHWLKYPIYEIARLSERTQYAGKLTNQVIQQAVRDGDESYRNHYPDSILSDGDFSTRLHVVRAVVEMTELGLPIRPNYDYLFPRGLEVDHRRIRLGTEAKDPVVFEWDFYPEVVLHRFIVRAIKTREVVDDKYCRSAVVVKLDTLAGEVVVTVVGQPANATIELYFNRRVNELKRTYGIAVLYERFKSLVGEVPIITDAGGTPISVPSKPYAGMMPDEEFDFCEEILKDPTDAHEALSHGDGLRHLASRFRDSSTIADLAQILPDRPRRVLQCYLFAQTLGVAQTPTPREVYDAIAACFDKPSVSTNDEATQFPYSNKGEMPRFATWDRYRRTIVEIATANYDRRMMQKLRELGIKRYESRRGRRSRSGGTFDEL